MAKIDLSAYDAVGCNELEALFNSVDSDREEGAAGTSHTKGRNPHLPSRLQRGRTLVPKRFQASRSQEPLTRGRTLGALPSQRIPWKTGTTSGPKDGPGKSIGAAVKDILARRQRGLFKVTQSLRDPDTGLTGEGSYSRKTTDIDAADWHGSTSSVSRNSFRLMPSSDRAKEATSHQHRRPTRDRQGLPTQRVCRDGGHCEAGNPSPDGGAGGGCGASHDCSSRDDPGDIATVENSAEQSDDSHTKSSLNPSPAHTATSTDGGIEGSAIASYPPPLPLPVARWDWKSLLIAWSAPLDQMLTALRVVSSVPCPASRAHVTWNGVLLLTVT